MKKIITLLKRQYFDWRTWNYLYQDMKKQTKMFGSVKSDSKPTPIPYLNKPGITFSMDDSYRVHDWYTYGKDLFGYYDVKVSFNINAFHHYEDEREHTQSEIDMLLDLQSNGHEVAHHGYKHKDAVDYSRKVGLKKWIKDEIEGLFDWMEKQSHSKTGERFKKPVTFVYPKFSYNEQTLKEIVPKYFKVVRGHRRGNNLTPNNHIGFAPSICIDSHYLVNPRNIKKVLKYVKKSGGNLILTCHSILPDDIEWEEFEWEMDEHAKKWRTSPKVIEYIIKEARLLDLEFYTTAEIAGVATFIDRNFERFIRKLLSMQSGQWIPISSLMSFKELDLSNNGITNLDGIQYFLGVEKLNLSNNHISDFRLLERLPNLKEVNIDNQSKKPAVNRSILEAL
jgi:peptidoglycan/xylan/chitin deacetylase (PgdA/CDA1 family)